ncbi:FAD-dependent oxidoreductase [Streptomyces sp. NPDC047974]|uniref:FAD-dependent oxidoreductase n=1 Tax=Streptomyces sp. NPDC047974 TaxID=3154343 RepID=UPI0033D6F503
MNAWSREARAVDVLVVGAGPAGLAAAARLAALGTGRVEVLEREPEGGGVPRFCAHPGFGPDPRGRALDGPGFARRAVRAAVRAGAVLRTGVSVVGWAGPLALETAAPAGPETLVARAVVLATGARERSRPARLIPGTRTEGVLTAGELHRTVALFGPRPERIGRRAVVVGGGPTAGHAVSLLRRAGVTVAAVVREERYAAALGVPVAAETVVTELTGRGRLAGVTVRNRHGHTRSIRCDTLVLTGDWIPEHELARAGGLPLAPGTRAPLVDATLCTAVPGVFAAGGLLAGGTPAVRAAAEGRRAAEAVRAYLAAGAAGGSVSPG